jgi:parallel beta-helix repeat protein
MQNNEKALAQTSHAPFNITSNDDFASMGWPGSGTEEDPYVIGDILIENDSLCIYVTNTTAYFRIVDSVLRGSGKGIWFQNVTHATISNCSMEQLSQGIDIWECNYSEVVDCVFQDMSDTAFSAFEVDHFNFTQNDIQNATRGVSLGYSLNVSVTHNQMSDCEWSGISVFAHGNDSVIAHNEVVGVEEAGLGWGAISVEWGSNWVVESNTIMDSTAGIALSVSDDNMISGNTIGNVSSAISLTDSSSNTIDSNTIEDCPSGIYSLEGEDNTISNNEFDSIYYQGIRLRYSTSCTITNNSMHRGIYIIGNSPSSWNHDVTGNTLPGGELMYVSGKNDLLIDGSNVSQLIIANSNNVTVEKAMLVDTVRGATIAYSEECSLIGSTILKSRHSGVEVWYSQDIILDQNNVTSNTQAKYGQYGGIVLWNSNGVNVTRSVIYNNTRDGIGIYNSDDCLLYNNWISNNTNHGIFVGDGEDNTIFGNAIGWNEGGNAHDAGTNNQWDNGEDLGNWWSNYNDTETYEIEGDADSEDRYPNSLNELFLTIPIGEEKPIDWAVPAILLVGVAAVVIIIAALVKKKR